MKYRIKDGKQRRLIKQLFDVEEINSEHTATELRVDLCFDDINFASNYLPVEKIQELEDGWHPFPQEKPSKNDTYLIARKGTDTVDVAGFNSVIKKFRTCFDADIIAWREMPKIWKE